MLPVLKDQVARFGIVRTVLGVGLLAVALACGFISSLTLNDWLRFLAPLVIPFLIGCAVTLTLVDLYEGLKNRKEKI